MTMDTALGLLDQIETSSSKGLREDFRQAAVRYARVRTDWRLATVEARADMDAARKRAHDALIGACNALSRFMATHGESTQWRTCLGEDRKTIGDFACYVHCILGIQAR